MFISLIRQLKIISQSYWYWWANIISSLTLLAVALYYQYVPGDLPCVMCIQVRLWLSLLIIISIVGLVSQTVRDLHRNSPARWINGIAHMSVVITAMGLTERAYQLLGTERGFVFGDCGFDLGLPAWFTPDIWLPWIFQVDTSCGYTPEIAFGITMAEALMVLSVLLLVVSSCVFIASFVHLKSMDKE